MEEKRKQQRKSNKQSKKDANFRPSSDVKGIRFGGQFIIKSFTVRRAAPQEFLHLLHSPSPTSAAAGVPYPFTTAVAYIPTRFTILAHEAWHTLTLGLGTRRSKALIFIFDSDAMRAAVDRAWPPVIALGDVNRRLVRGLSGCEMARFKFRKGCLTFYLYAVRRVGAAGFGRAEDLMAVIESVAALNDFLDHTAMLAIPSQRSIGFSPPMAMAQ